MNFFYGINNDIFKSEIQIPLFKNRILKTLNLELFRCFPQNKKWIIEEIKNKKINDYFIKHKKIYHSTKLQSNTKNC